MADKFKMSNSTTGNYWKIENGKRVFYNKAGKKIDQSAFLKAEDAHIDNNGKLKGNKIYVKGSTSGRYWKIIDGKRHYFAADGTEINEKYFFQQEGVQKNAKGQIVKNSRVNNTKIQKKSAKSIADDLKKATKGINDEAAIKTAIAKVDNPEELQELERLLEAEGYKADDMYSAVEKFLYKEMTGLTTDNSFDYLEETVQKWIQNGTLQGQAANKAQARMAARVIRDGGDGMGTDCDEVKRGIAMIKAPKPTGNAEVDKANARRVMAEVERIIKNAHGETLEEYLRGEMWDGEVKELKASLAANKAMSDENNVQAVVDLVIKAVNGAGTNEERLEQALKSITTREERIAVNKKLEEYCKQQGIKIDKKVGQDAIQAILYDELDKNMGTAVDHKQVRKYNEMLIKQGAYNKDEETQIRAQQAAKQVMEGDFENIMDAVENIEDPEVLKSMNNMLAANNLTNLDTMMAKKGLDKTEQNLVNANLASKNLLSDEKAAQVAYELLNEKDYNNRAAGFAAIRKDSVHKLVEEKLKKEGKSLEKVLADFNKEKAWRKDVSEKYDTAAFAGGLLTGWLAESRSDELRENTDMSDNLYLETDKGEEVPAEKKAAYDAALAKIEGDLNKLKEDYQAARDDEGLLSGFVNGVASIYNLGTTRDEIEARIEHDEETVRLLKLASEGKLTKMVDGKQVPVSFEEIFKERQSAVISANQASLSKLFGVDKSKAETNFDANKVTAVSKQGEQIAAMNIAKDLITDSWSELNSAIESKNVDKLTAGITGTMKKLETMTGEKMNLDSFGYSMKDGVIVDKSGNAVSADKLTEVANKLKTCVSDTAKALYGKEIPANADNGDVSELINDGYEAKMEEFKAQYRAAYGQDATDEMIEDYLSTISTGVTIINIGAAIGAAILTAGAGSFAVFAAVGGTSMALNTVEHATDANGLSVNEFMTDAEQALWDGALAAVGVKVGKYAEGFATSEKVLAKNAQFLSKIGVGEKTAEKAAKWVARVEAAGGEVSSDTIQSLAQMYCMEGEFDEESFVRALIMSAGFNTAGHFASALKGADVNAGKKADVDGVRTADSADGVKSADEAEARVELEGVKAQDAPVSQEFKSAMDDLEASVKSGKNNTVGELVESNPVFTQFKDEFAGLNDYKITFLDDATNTNLGQHSKKQIALNFDALKENEEAFVNTLLHEAEHARQHKRFYEIQFKPKAERTEAENRFYKAYRDMIKANEARADFYKANKDAIDKFVKGEKLTAEEKAIVEQYKKLYDSYKSDALETEAREAGAKAADKYRANKEVANGQKAETEQGTRGVQKDDSAGHQDGTVGSAARNENAEGTTGTKAVDETPKISAADEKYLTKPSEGELPDNMEFADGNENVLLVYDGDTVVKTYEYAGNNLHKISEVADEGRVETTYTPTGYVETRITYDEAGNGYGFIAINNPKVNVGIQNILDENGNAIASNLFNAETNKPISTRVKSEDGGIIETKYNTDGKPVERNEFYENGSVKSETTIDPESEIVLTQKEYNQDGILTNEASFDTETNKGKGTMLDANGNPRSYEYDTQENFRWSDEEAAPVEDKKPSLILDPNAVTPNPNTRFIVDPNEVTPNPNARFIVDPNEVTPNPDAKIIDPNAVEPNTTPLIKPETESPAPREVVKYDNAPEEKKSRIIIDPNAPTPMPGFKFIDPKAVTPNPNARFIVDPNEVTPNPNARFIVDPNEVTPNPDAKIIDPNAVEPNTTPLIKPEFESPAPREVVKYDDTPNTEVTKPKAEISTPNSANISDAATPVLNGNSLTVGDKTIELPTELREVNDLLKNKQFTIERNDKTLIVLLSDDGNTKLYIDHFEGSNTGHRFTIQTRPDNSVDWINSDQIDFWKQDGKERSWQVATYKHGENTKTELRHYNEKGEIIPDETPKTEAESRTPKTDEAETATPETEAESGTPKAESESETLENPNTTKPQSNVKDGKYKFGDKEIEIPKSLKDAETLANNNTNFKIYDYGNGKKELQFLDSSGKKVAAVSFDGKGRINQFTEFEGDNAVSRIEYNKHGEARRRYTNDGNGNWTKDKEFKADKHQYKLGPKAQAVVDKFKEAKEKADNLVNKFNEKITQHRVKRTTTKTDANGNTVEIAYLSGKNDNKRIETVKNRNGKTIEVRRFDDKGRLRSRKVTTDQYDLNIEYDKKGNEVSFKKETKDSNGKVIKTETSKDKGDHSFGYTNADGDNVNVVFKDGEKVQTTTYQGNSDIIMSEKQFTDNGTVETTYPDGKQPNQWNESTTIWKDNKGNIYRQKELAANGDIYDKVTYDDGTTVEFTASNGGMSTKVTKDGEDPVNYRYNFENKLFEAVDEDGNVTHRGVMKDGTWTELDENGNAVKTYEHKDKQSHKVRNTLVGAAVIGGAAYGSMALYEAITSPDAAEPATENPAAEEQNGGNDGGASEVTDEQNSGNDGGASEVTDEQNSGNDGGASEVTDEQNGGNDGGTSEVTDEQNGGNEGGASEVTDEQNGGNDGGNSNGSGTTPTTTTTPGGSSTPTTPTTPQEDKPPIAGEVPPQVYPGQQPVNPQPVTPQPQDDKPEDTPDNKPEEKPTIKDPVGGIDPVTGEKREIAPHERMQITEHINEAKNMEDVKLIQKEIRSFKKFPGRKNLRKALRAKRRLLKAQEKNRSERVIERRENKLEKRMDKVEKDNIIYQNTPIGNEYDNVNPEKDEFKPEKRFDA